MSAIGATPSRGDCRCRQPRRTPRCPGRSAHALPNRPLDRSRDRRCSTSSTISRAIRDPRSRATAHTRLRERARTRYVVLRTVRRENTSCTPSDVQSLPSSFYVHQLKHEPVGTLSTPVASRLLWLPVHASVVITGHSLARGWLPWPLALATSLLIGFAFAGLMCSRRAIDSRCRRSTRPRTSARSSARNTRCFRHLR
jgi:hypothetical protein